jgi:hypothetical protein
LKAVPLEGQASRGPVVWDGRVFHCLCCANTVRMLCGGRIRTCDLQIMSLTR